MRDIAIPDLTGSCESANRYYCDVRCVEGEFRTAGENILLKKEAGPLGTRPFSIEDSALKPEA
jgi:hypothetical protein